MTDTPIARLAMVSIDCPDVTAMVDFYVALLGWEVAYADEEANYAMLQNDGSRLGFGRSTDYRPPRWPDQGAKQFHLDLATDDIAATTARCIELGATQPEEQPGGGRWTVLLDPAGHPFCLTHSANWGLE